MLNTIKYIKNNESNSDCVGMRPRKSSILNMSIIYSLIIFIILVSLGEASHKLYETRKQKYVSEKLFSLTNKYSQEIQRNLNNGMYVVNTLEAILDLVEYDASSFDKWAPHILESNSNVSVIQLAEAGTVSHIYPLEHNEKAMGHNLLKDKNRDDGALIAIENKEVTLVGPIRLIQNDKIAVIVRKPVFRQIDGKEEFWGFTIALIYVDDILIPELKKMESQGYAYRIIGNDPDSDKAPIILASSSEEVEWECSYPIVVPNGEWMIQMAYVESEDYTYLHFIIILVSLIISSLYLFQQTRIHKRTVKIEELNNELKKMSYTDYLTNIKNRRGAFILLEALMKEAALYSRPLSVGLMDIDFFKNVNDTLGHDGGDSALLYIVNLFQENLREGDILARIGGDEFICIFTNTDLEKANAIAKRLKDILGFAPFNYLGKEIFLTFSMGITQLSSDEESLKSFITRADKALYEAKANGRNQIKSTDNK
ncbi:sensor domain-containing diguanylate cyclase [Wukongibacter baidiensis]|uniref:sensor domain-containing diguanylate cyclase n=1 Tax=Wukongibacter baidiensis TaxID=1723361 RepID=UPI003D7FEECB